VECPPGASRMFRTVPGVEEQEASSVVYSMRRVDLFEDVGLDRGAIRAGAATARAASMLTARLAEVLNEMYACVLFRQLMRHSGGPIRCSLAALSWRLGVLEDNILEIVLTGQMLGAPAPEGGQQHLAKQRNQLLRFLVPEGVVPRSPSAQVPELAIRRQIERRCAPHTLGCQDGTMPTSLKLVRRTRHLRQLPATHAAAYALRPLQSRALPASHGSEGSASLAIVGSPAPWGPSMTSLSAPSPDRGRQSPELTEAAAAAVGVDTHVSTPVGAAGQAEDVQGSPPEGQSDLISVFGLAATVGAASSPCLGDDRISVESDMIGARPVLVSALSTAPDCQVERYCGLVTVHMIKENVNVTKQFESLQVFYHQFVAETLSTAKAHVLAVGGDALLGYRINNLFLREESGRAYAVISISGDAAKLGV